MTHPRTQIRNLTVAHLQGATDAANRVHAGRLMPLDDRAELAQLPAIVVHTRMPEEIIKRSPSGWSGYEKRRCIVSVIIVAQSFGDLDEDLDTMAGQVEAAMQTWIVPGFESAEIEPHTTTSSDPEFDGSLSTGSTTLEFPVVYTTPYRDCSNPYVISDDEPLERSGTYPGGRVTAGCPSGGTGEACPIDDVVILSQGERIN